MATLSLTLFLYSCKNNAKANCTGITDFMDENCTLIADKPKKVRNALTGLSTSLFFFPPHKLQLPQLWGKICCPPTCAGQEEMPCRTQSTCSRFRFRSCQGQMTHFRMGEREGRDVRRCVDSERERERRQSAEKRKRKEEKRTSSAQQEHVNRCMHTNTNTQSSGLWGISTRAGVWFRIENILKKRKWPYLWERGRVLMSDSLLIRKQNKMLQTRCGLKCWALRW